MDRQQLIDIVNRFIDFSHAIPFDAANLGTIMSKDLNYRILQPRGNALPKFDGVAELIAKAHEAAPGFKLTIQETVVDEEKSTVVGLVDINGIQSGYFFSIYI